MRRSLKLLVLGVAVPGALSPVLYAALTDGDDRHATVRVEEPLRVRVADEVRVDVEVDVERAVERAARAAERAAERAARQAELAARRAELRVRIAERNVGMATGRCELESERSLSLAAGAGDLLAVRAGSGELEVQGVEGLDEVRVVATLCASDEGRLDGLDVTLDREGDEVRLETRYPSDGTSGRSYARIDLRVEVPRGMAADVEDSSGEMRLAGVGALTIDDSSGEIEVVGADGSVRIDDSSGEITLRDVAGDIDVQDGSGDIEIQDVQGSVRLTDGSGSIEVRDVERDVVVERDGSGSIAVHEVGGDFRVERDGSGGIDYSGVRGQVDIPERR